eukprot:1158006-Pelagomonas_calceolata.AAC.23
MQKDSCYSTALQIRKKASLPGVGEKSAHCLQAHALRLLTVSKCEQTRAHCVQTGLLVQAHALRLQTGVEEAANGLAHALRLQTDAEEAANAAGVYHKGPACMPGVVQSVLHFNLSLSSKVLSL